MSTPLPLTADQRRQLEQTYAQALSTAVLLAKMLGKEPPTTRADRRKTNGGRSSST